MKRPSCSQTKSGKSRKSATAAGLRVPSNFEHLQCPVSLAARSLRIASFEALPSRGSRQISQEDGHRVVATCSLADRSGYSGTVTAVSERSRGDKGGGSS